MGEIQSNRGIQRSSIHAGLTARDELAHIATEHALGNAELLNPLDGRPHARFLAFRSEAAQRWYGELKAQDCITDVRGDVLRIGFGIYQDEADVERLVQLLGRLN